MKRIVSLVVVFACLVLGRRDVVDANDEKWTGADSCIGETSSDTGFQLNSSTGVLNSLSSGTRAFQCPIVRDDTTNTTGLVGATVCWDLSHSPTAATASCSLCSYDLGSYVVECVTKGQTGGDTSCETWDSNDVNTSEDPGYYTLRCELTGAAAKLISYQWVEP